MAAAQVEAMVISIPMQEPKILVVVALLLDMVPVQLMTAAVVAAAGTAAAPMAVHRPHPRRIAPLIVAVAPAALAMCGHLPLPNTLLQDTASLLPTISPMHRPSAATPACPTRTAAQ